MSNAANVTTGKPKVGGAVHRAPVGSTLPTSASATLDATFKDLGYISEDGVTNANSPESTNIKAWGGDTVMTAQTDKDDTFQLKLIEALNPDVLKTVYGDANVTGTLATGITVNVNSAEQEESAYVVDMILRGGAAKRIVIPRGKVTEIGDIVYKDDDVVGYNLTLKALPDNNGQTHYEYMVAASTT